MRALAYRRGKSIILRVELDEEEMVAITQIVDASAPDNDRDTDITIEFVEKIAQSYRAMRGAT